MKKMLVFIKKKDGLTLEEFRSHYENVHIPLCGERIGHLIADFRRYYPENLVNLYVGRPDEADGRDGGFRYDAVSIYTVKEGALEELIKIGQDPEFQRLISEDEERFCSRVDTLEGFTEEYSGPGLNGA